MFFSLFTKKERITTLDAADSLGLSVRMARNLMKKWVEEGWLVVADKSNRSRTYGLSAIKITF